MLTKIFGSKHERDVKELRPVVDEINQFYTGLSKLSEEELKEKTNEYRAIIKENTKVLEEEKAKILNKLKNDVLNPDETNDLLARLKSLEKELFQLVQDTLDELLPEAFAVVKEVCRRLTEEKFTYEYAGQTYRWDMIPYDVQLIGGMVIHQGKIAEMGTGEGKTLVAVLPIYLNALAGKGVHVVTVNDYLAKRDCDWMRPVYEYLGITVGALQGKMDHKERQRVYSLDIVYGTNNEFGFDYLRDNMVVDPEHMVQREHWFAIIDEVDSVLIDEARTPLIISGPVGQVDQKFEEMNPRVRRLVDAQSKLVTSFVREAEESLAKNTKEEKDNAGVKIFTAYRGFPKHKKLIKLLQDPDNQKLKQDTELFFMRDQSRRMHEIDDALFYTIDEKNHVVDISEKGRELLSNSQEDPDMFLIPDITTELSKLEVDETVTPEDKQLVKDELNILYAERSDRIHTVNQLLRAYSLYEKDVEYVIQDGKINIVDEFTGRILDGRRYSDGLHQAIEAKEGVKVERDTQTLATITIQNYFRQYHKLSGMTGTAETEAGEFDKIYKLEVVVIPTNRPIVRKDLDDLIFKTKREKYNALIEEIKVQMAEGRAILVGTTNVEVSEVISKMLKRQNIKHNVLNAKHHEKEAEIITQAGKKGALTIATNMAGRGTDIKIDPDVRKSGGLSIIGSERHDARRIDRQLRGRTGRQGDPGSSIFFISLEDDLMRLFQGDRIAGVMQTLKIPEGEPIQHSMISKTVERAQKKVEENNFSVRKRLLEYDDVMNQQREVIYTRRKNALRGDRLRGELFEYIEDMAYDWFEKFHPELEWENAVSTVRSTLLCDLKVTKDEFTSIKQDEFVEKVVKAADDFYKRKEELLGSEFMSRLERVAVLQTIDEKWREHLRVMDDLKEGIHLRSYGQKDPLLEYKGEAYGLFVELIKDVNKNSVSFAFKYFPQAVFQQQQEKNQRRPRFARNAKVDDAKVPELRNTTVSGSLQFERTSTFSSGQPMDRGVPQMRGPEGGLASTVREQHRRTEDKIGRNDTVEVRYTDGRKIKAKYKKVQKDIENGICEVIEK